VLLNAELEILWCNEPAHYLLNIRSPQDIGYRISNLLRNPEFIKYLDDRDARESIEIASPNHPTITVQIKVISIGGSQSLLIAHNVSDQKLLQESLKNFVANASHELKSPLTVIAGHLEMLEDEQKLSSAGRASLQVAIRQTDRMRDLIRSLLLLSQVESYQLRPDEGELVSLGAIMLNTLAAVEKYSSHERVVYFYPADWLVLGVKAELEGICINLVENALKYSTPNTPIQVSWESNPPGEFLFTVINNGPGIEALDLPRLTERYFRAARNTTDIAGSGLGLAIVQHAANKHGATLEFNSTPDEQTRFCVTFPSYRCLDEQRKTARVYRLSNY
jgi:two-component system phosphate regulon sensor histidine kinase PhoR